MLDTDQAWTDNNMLQMYFWYYVTMEVAMVSKYFPTTEKNLELKLILLILQHELKKTAVRPNLEDHSYQLPEVLIQYICSYPPNLKAIYVCKLRMDHAVATKNEFLTMVFYEINTLN